MQTFLPYASFRRSAEVLDRARLGKQRVETMQIMGALVGARFNTDTGQAEYTDSRAVGWVNHPAVRMWRGYEHALYAYQDAVCWEWKSRGYSDTCLDKTRKICVLVFGLGWLDACAFSEQPEPIWLGDERLHRSHRSQLLSKSPEWYSRKFLQDEPDLVPGLPYLWPV